MGSCPKGSPGPPLPTASAKSMHGLVGCELLEGRSGQQPLWAQGPCPVSSPGPRWRCSPAVPGRTQRFGSLGTRQSPTGGCRVAPLGYESALGCRPQMMSHLHSGDRDLWNPIPGTRPGLDPQIGPCPFPCILVSLQMGRYSSCWMSSMISRPLPMPPARLGSELCGSALKV